MEKLQNDQIKKVIRQVLPTYYFLITIVICVVGAVSFWYLRLDWIIWYVSIFALLHISWITILFKSDYVADEFFVPYYYIFINIYLFPGILFLWDIHVYSVMLLYVLLPLIILFRYHASKQTIYASISSAALIVAILVISAKFQLLQANINQDITLYLNMVCIVAAMTFIIVFAYFYHEISKEKEGDDKNESAALLREMEKERLKKLYNNIIDYFETKQPYRQPNYRLAMLATDLNTNTKYLSEAINAHFGGTFESLLNKYRLDFAKKMLDEQLADKYTIEYIYTMAGYSSRSAFYQNFRKTFKMKPMEYQQKHIKMSK